MLNVFEYFYLICFAVGSAIRGYYSAKCRKQKEIKLDRKTALDIFFVSFSSLGMFILPALYLFTTYIDFANYQLSKAVGRLGMVVFIFALYLFWRSHHDLGKNWSVSLEIRTDQTLVTAGVYKHIRHPMYLAHILWAVAQFMLLSNWLAGPSFFILSTPLFFYRMPKEEKMMVERFGQQYLDYIKKTKRLIPFIY